MTSFVHTHQSKKIPLKLTADFLPKNKPFLIPFVLHFAHQLIKEQLFSSLFPRNQNEALFFMLFLFAI
jgi:hypothetical protein